MMNMRKKLFLLLMIFVSMSSYGWDAVGHRVIAELAYRNLNAHTRKQVDKLLGTRGIVYFSSWADEIKSDTIYPQSKNGWHFQNLRSGLSDADVLDFYHQELGGGKYLFYVLDSISSALKAGRSDADQLKFVVHLMGDFFQPMHLGRPEDKGGNRVQMRWFNQGTNLHSVWDGKLISYTHFSYQEYADYLTDKYGEKKKQVWKMSIEDCVLQTYHLQNEVYDYQAQGDDNTYHYAYRFRESLDWQLYTAGIQLAKRLTEIFK